MYQQFIQDFMVEAGTIFKKYYFSDKQTIFKSDTTPLTLADTEINSLFIQRVQASFPVHAVMGEEESAGVATEYVWIIDPVDGTIPYSHSMPISTIVVSLLHFGIPVIGAVYDPIGDKLFWGDGKQSRCNTIPQRVTGENDIKKSVVAIECFPRARYDFKKLFGALCDLDIKVMQFCSIAYPSSLVASGELLATIHPAKHPREFAAIKPIVEGAGGKVTDLFGEQQTYNHTNCRGGLATNGAMHDFFVDLIRQNVDLSK